MNAVMNITSVEMQTEHAVTDRVLRAVDCRVLVLQRFCDWPSAQLVPVCCPPYLYECLPACLTGVATAPPQPSPTATWVSRVNNRACEKTSKGTGGSHAAAERPTTVMPTSGGQRALSEGNWGWLHRPGIQQEGEKETQFQRHGRGTETWVFSRCGRSCLALPFVAPRMSRLAQS